jgi:hypothetical protein
LSPSLPRLLAWPARRRRQARGKLREHDGCHPACAPAQPELVLRTYKEKPEEQEKVIKAKFKK